MDPYTLLYPTLTPHTIPIPTDTSPPITLHALTSPPPSASPPLPPLLLLHGFPQNLLIWHRLVPLLTPHYTLILLDLRGYGKSSKPASSPPHTLYSKRALAADCAAAMSHLGHTQFYLCGHDRGARVGHRLCIDYPSRVLKALFLDIAPTLAMYEQTDLAFATAYWHWFFLVQPAPLPETLMARSPRAWIEGTMGRGAGMGAFRAECVESYVGQVGDEAGAHGMCEDYRAGRGVDLEEAREDERRGRRIECAVRVLWGEKGVVGGLFDAVGEWRGVCGGEVSGEGVDCGHYIPEEAPGEVVRHILEFLRE